ncbi:Ig-like domain-containing protein, partial [Methanosarcina mazei]|uniref:Ig-like domain-containing protein n=1 Tax=Methanosarcina mazei TaxID=2209 RepID=UPI00064FCB9F
IWDWYFKNSINLIELDNYTYTDATNISLVTEELEDSTSAITVTVSGSPDSDIPAAGVPVDLATSLGTIYPSTITTDALGKADALLISDREGIATVEAFGYGGAFTTVQEQVYRLDLTVLDYQSIVDKDSEWLTDRLVLNGNSSFNNVTGNLEMPQTGPFGSTITWQKSDSNTVSPDGIITRPAFGEMDKEVCLTAVISKGDKESIKEFWATIKATRMSSAEKIAEDYRLLTAEMILNENISLDCITSKVTLPTEGLYGSRIAWRSNSFS